MSNAIKINSLTNAHGLIAACASCGRVRKFDGTWIEIDTVPCHLNDLMTHTICRDCIERLYPDVLERIEKNGN